MKKCAQLWREERFQVKMYKADHSWTTSGSWDVQKVRAAVARSTFLSQSVKNWRSWVLEHFWKLRCSESARRCGAKHISKSKMSNTDRFGPFFDVQTLFCMAGARDCEPCQNWAKREVFVAVSITTTRTLHYNRLQYTPLHYTTLHYTQVHYT